MLRKVVLTVLF
jgi:hypothetical protein